MNDYEIIWNFLREFFNFEHYTMAIENARKVVTDNTTYKKNWQRIVTIIQNRDLRPGEPLKLVHEGANQVLDENTDEEAYVWLEKMVNNIENVNNPIEEY